MWSSPWAVATSSSIVAVGRGTGVVVDESAGRPEPDRIEEYPEKGNALSNNPIAGTGHRRPKVSSVGHNKLPEIRIV